MIEDSSLWPILLSVRPFLSSKCLFFNSLKEMFLAFSYSSLITSSICQWKFITMFALEPILNYRQALVNWISLWFWPWIDLTYWIQCRVHDRMIYIIITSVQSLISKFQLYWRKWNNKTNLGSSTVIRKHANMTVIILTKSS
jgi:hypothetical protein